MPKTRYYLCIFILLFSLFSLQGQSKKEKFSIEAILDDIRTAHNVIFNYNSQLLEGIEIFAPKDNLSLLQKIEVVEQQTDLLFKKINNSIYAISKSVKVCGYIKDRYLQQPLAGATIQGTSKYAISDENGYFEIASIALDDMLSIRYIGFKTIDVKVGSSDLNQCETFYMTERQEVMSTILLETYLVKGIDKNKDWTTTIDYEKFSLLPGLIESDVLQTVQALPSILSVDETVSNLNIRGGSNDQNLVLWDGIKMYQTGHFFGLISSFNPYMTQTAKIINNGTDASYTDGISGTIAMQTKTKIDSSFSGTFGLNFLNAEVFSTIPLGKKSSLQVASRKSLDGLVRTPTYKVYFDRVTQETEAESNVTEVTNSDQEFTFHDVSLRWLYQASNKDAIRFNFLLVHNDLSFNETASLNGFMSSRESSVSQNSIAFGLNYKRQWQSDFFTELTLYNTDYKLQAKNADVLANQLFLQENKVSETNLKVDNVYNANNWTFKFGYNFTETEVTNLNDIDLPRFVRRDEEIIREHALYGQAFYRNTNKNFSVRGGLRGNYIDKFNKSLIEPRLSIRKGVGNHIEIEALGELKHQNTSQIVNFQNDFLGIEKRRWQLADNDSIPILESKQASIGILYKNNGWLLDLKGYYKTVKGITTQSQSFTTKYEFERTKGSYDAYGLELLFRKKLKKFNNWFSYSYINNTYTFDRLEEKNFPSNFDITHSLTLGSTYSGKAWHISAGINYRIGKPTSMPVEENEVMGNDINYGTANSSRLQDYLRIDASALYKFNLTRKLRSEVGASVWNLTGYENTINNYYRVEDSNTVTRFSRFSLGLTTNAVLRVYF